MAAFVFTALYASSESGHGANVAVAANQPAVAGMPGAVHEASEQGPVSKTTTAPADTVEAAATDAATPEDSGDKVLTTLSNPGASIVTSDSEAPVEPSDSTDTLHDESADPAISSAEALRTASITFDVPSKLRNVRIEVDGESVDPGMPLPVMLKAGARKIKVVSRARGHATRTKVYEITEDRVIKVRLRPRRRRAKPVRDDLIDLEGLPPRNHG